MAGRQPYLPAHRPCLKPPRRLGGSPPACSATGSALSSSPASISTSALIGLIAGLGAVLFTYGLELAKFLLVEKLAGYRQIHPHNRALFDFSFFDAPTYGEYLWLLLLLPALGGLLSGYLTHRFAPEAQGAGTDAMIDAFHNQRGHIRPIVAPVKALATIVTLASGGAAGQQGPLVHIGAGLGSWVGDKLKLSVAQRRIFVAGGHGWRAGCNFPRNP